MVQETKGLPLDADADYVERWFVAPHGGITGTLLKILPCMGDRAALIIEKTLGAGGPSDNTALQKTLIALRNAFNNPSMIERDGDKVPAESVRLLGRFLASADSAEQRQAILSVMDFVQRHD